MSCLPALAASAVLLAGNWWSPIGYPAVNSVRVLAVPVKENGYHNFASQVIDSRAQFDMFKQTAEGESGWNNRATFLQVLDQAAIDFDRESLVLIRQLDGPGGMGVSLASPWLWGDTLYCCVRVTRNCTNRDHKARCFAVAVDKRKVRRVEVRVKEGFFGLIGELRETLVVDKQ